MLLSAGALRAQSDSLPRSYPHTSNGLIAGYHGFGYHYVELGIAGSEMLGRKMRGAAYSFSASLRLGGEKTIVGGSASAWTNWPLGIGINTDFFSDLKGSSTLRLRPELGITIDRARLVYGYSIVIAGGGFNGVNRHDFSLRLFLPFQ